MSIQVCLNLTEEEIQALEDHAGKRVLAFLTRIDRPSLMDSIMARLGQAGLAALEEKNAANDL
tara:strand:+ start:5371 stop:5559 length:189 start_codon:yes stop_codon:yes gene_type:complete